jgi:c-di-GMP-binding flagellar brake protein YcgR
MAFSTSFDTADLTPFKIHSRREIISLLRSLHERNQLVSMHADGEAEAVVTSILEIDEESGMLVVDCAPSDTVNQSIVASDNISFETVLDNIRIVFFATKIGECLYDNSPALCIAIPVSLIRLQRREYYRVPTSVANPLRCTIHIPHDAGDGFSTIVVPLQNVSGGGIAIVDEKKALDNTIGRIYKDCRIDLPGGSLVVATLQIRNSQEITLPNGKAIRRLGCLFVELPQSMLAAVQRYITKLERERNAKATGMG